MKELEKPMSFKEAQEFLGVSNMFLYKRLWRGEIIGHKLGRKWIIFPSDLQRFIDQQYTNQRKIRLAK